MVQRPPRCCIPKPSCRRSAIDEAVRRALDEDLGRAGDITSIATIPEATQARAIVVARQAGVIAGLPLAVETFQQLSPDVSIEAQCARRRRGRAKACRC